MATATEAKFSCAACGRQYSWKPELAGKKGKCKCGAPLNIPASIDEIAPPREAPAPPVAKAVAPAARPAAASAPAAPAQPARTSAKSAPAAREPSLSDLAALAKGEVRADDAYRCPWCGTALEPKSHICGNCKMNIKTGHKHDPKKAAKAASAARNSDKAMGKASGKTASTPKENQSKQLIVLGIVVVLLGASGLRFYLSRSGARDQMQDASSAIDTSTQKGHDAEARQLLAEEEPIEAREFLDANKQRSLGTQMTNNTAKQRVESWYGMGAKKIWAFNAIMSSNLVIELPDEKEKRAALIGWYNDYQAPDNSKLKDEGQKYLVLGF